MTPAPPNPPQPPGRSRTPTPRRPVTPVPRPLPPRPDRWVDRAIRLLTRTRAEWSAIAAVPMTPDTIYRTFVLPMAALGPIAGTIGTIVSGGERSTLAGTYTLSPVSAVAAGAFDYAFNLGAIWVLALLIDRLAPAFQAHQGRVDALKVAAFGATPYWVGGLLAIVPKLAPVGLLVGAYSLRLYALGLGQLMRAPGERVLSYTLAVGAACLVLVLIASAVLLLVTG